MDETSPFAGRSFRISSVEEPFVTLARHLKPSYVLSRMTLICSLLRAVAAFVCPLLSACRHLLMCCSKPEYHRSAFDGEVAPDADNKETVDVSFWNPFSLRFKRDAVERAFYRSVSQSWHPQDIIAHSLSILFVPAFFRALGPGIPRWHIIVIVFLSMFFAPLQLYTYCTNRARYERYRLFSTVFSRWVSYYALSHFCRYFEAPSPTFFMLMLAFLVKSPAVHLTIMSVHHRLEFRYHVPVQIVAFLMGTTWISPFCQTCSEYPELAHKFEQVGYGIDWSFSQAVLNRPPDTMAYPCWMITTFIFTVTGFIVPTAVIFITEAMARKAFLESRSSQEVHFSILKYANEAIRVGILAFLAAILGTWFCLSTVRDSLY